MAELNNVFTMPISDIIYAVLLGIGAFLIIYVIIPILSAFAIMCVFSIICESYSMVKNTIMLIKNIYKGATSDIKIVLDGFLVFATVYYTLSMLLQ
jgi:hypothetical protein